MGQFYLKVPCNVRLNVARIYIKKTENETTLSKSKYVWDAWVIDYQVKVRDYL